VLANPLIRSVIQSLVAQARRSPDLVAVLDGRFQTPRRQAPDDLLVSEQLLTTVRRTHHIPTKDSRLIHQMKTETFMDNRDYPSNDSVNLLRLSSIDRTGLR
jgi:hypothetical protein